MRQCLLQLAADTSLVMLGSDT